MNRAELPNRSASCRVLIASFILCFDTSIGLVLAATGELELARAKTAHDVSLLIELKLEANNEIDELLCVWLARYSVLKWMNAGVEAESIPTNNRSPDY